MAAVKNLFLLNSITLVLAIGGLLLIWHRIFREKQEWQMLRFFQIAIVVTPLIIFSWQWILTVILLFFIKSFLGIIIGFLIQKRIRLSMY
ncbi:hypothetical protein V6R94_06760 [Pediococcus acidilactici]